MHDAPSHDDLNQKAVHVHEHVDVDGLCSMPIFQNETEIRKKEETMKNQINLHFDELLLSILFLICLGIWTHHPDAKEWAGGVLAALIMALRNKGQDQDAAETKQQ